VSVPHVREEGEGWKVEGTYLREKGWEQKSYFSGSRNSIPSHRAKELLLPGRRGGTSGGGLGKDTSWVQKGRRAQGKWEAAVASVLGDTSFFRSGLQHRRRTFGVNKGSGPRWIVHDAENGNGSLAEV